MVYIQRKITGKYNKTVFNCIYIKNIYKKNLIACKKYNS